jgi:hypothetical protein
MIFISSKGSKKNFMANILRPIGSAIEAVGFMNPTRTFCKKDDFHQSLQVSQLALD